MFTTAFKFLDSESDLVACLKLIQVTIFARQLSLKTNMIGSMANVFFTVRKEPC
jgi:hypothetical protein